MRRERRRPQAWHVAAALIGLLALAAWGWRAADGAAQRARGAALFAGQEALAGRLWATTSRCQRWPRARQLPRDCQRRGTAATALTAAELTTARVRRGGPASVFDAGRLCALLRDGIDPAHVIISTTMPRYEIGDEQCQALWSYLMTR